MIGNDVVDLRDPGARESHPRFDERVMAPSERSWLARRAAPARDRWLLWAAKEAAYKAAKRMDARLVWAPRRFVVELDRAGDGRVTIGEARFDVRVRVADDAVHAVASLDGTAPSAIVAGCRRGLAHDPSAAARRLAIEAVGADRRGSLEVAMRGRLPELRSREGSPIPLSLSHHGEVVGFAARLADAPPLEEPA
jgi:phosphopantetheinyl transferase (holo-ACP synthase)